MASKRQRRQKAPGSRKAKPKRKLPPPPNILLGRQGLVADPNADLFPNKRQQLIDPVSVWVAPPPEEPKPAHISEFDRKYIEPLLKKHAEDYVAMARDIKLNRDQLTAARLRKLHQLLIESSEQ